MAATSAVLMTTSSIWVICLWFLCALIQMALQDDSVAGSKPAEGSSVTDPLIAQPANQESDDILDVYGLPGFQHEFRIEIKAGASECFYQKLRKEMKLHMSFEVLRGADRNIDVFVKDPTGTLIGTFQWTNEGNLEQVISEPGIYSFCIDNNLSRFSSKLVYLYMLAYSDSDWTRYVNDIQEFYGEVENFTKTLEKFDQHVNKALVLQAQGRRHLVADWYLLKANNVYVQRLSIAMCVVIVITSAVQVVFVRRLFSTPPKVKPRA